MSLDGYLGKNWKDPLKKRFISFDDDAYYWELYPTFEKVRSRTGQRIDLYDDAHFDGQAQIFLKQCLEDKLSRVLLQGDVWQVTTGWQIEHGEKTEVLAMVSKEELVGLLHSFIATITKAKKNKSNIIFLGD